jgi:ribosomal protein S18 acetylase RimI-like enzyme
MIRYTTSLEEIRPEMLTGFFVGWPNPPSSETHLRILRNSSHVVLAVDDAAGRVVGFVTALSDGILSAYIPMLEVLPDYKGQGVGTELIRRMMTHLKSLYMVDTVCDPELRSFYEQCGMRAATAMIVRNYDRQAG